jgi:hypothetical protein
VHGRAAVLTPADLQTLVRRDLTAAVAGTVAALVAAAAVAAGHLGLVSEVNGGRVAVALAALAGAGCLWWWTSGPRGLMRDRLLVVAPVFLVSGPGLVGVHDLGGGLAVAILSGGLGFAAAAAAGLVWSARRG